MVIAVERQRAIAVQYGSVLWHDGPLPVYTKKNTKYSLIKHTSEPRCIAADEGLQKHVTRKSGASLPVTPSYQYSSSKDKEEGHVREPHDDSHGIHTKDGPGRGERGRYRFRAAGIGAVLAGAGAWTVLQALSTGIRLVVHGSITRHWDILGKKNPAWYSRVSEWCAFGNVCLQQDQELIHKITTELYTWECWVYRKRSLSIVDVKHILDPVGGIAVLCFFPTQQR